MARRPHINQEPKVGTSTAPIMQLLISTSQGQQKWFSLANMDLSLQQDQYDGNETHSDPSHRVPFLLGMS